MDKESPRRLEDGDDRLLSGVAKGEGDSKVDRDSDDVTLVLHCRKRVGAKFGWGWKGLVAVTRCGDDAAIVLEIPPATYP